METNIEIRSKKEQGSGGQKEMLPGSGSPEMAPAQWSRADQEDRGTEENCFSHDLAYFPDRLDAIT
jgi:hypothetical protein